MKLNDFDFNLPSHLIAQHPAPERDCSRMMVVWRKTGKREHRYFRELPEILGPEHFLVVNNTRVIPARLRASREGESDEIEILLLRELGVTDWLVLAKPAKKARVGRELFIGNLRARVTGATESGGRILQFQTGTDLHQAFEKIGEPPVPPYIHRERGQDLSEDRIRYQTVFARHSGSMAAPTAGLHFTEDIFRRLENRGVAVCEILLHIGYGTFQPVRCRDIEAHQMEPEYYRIEPSTAASIRDYRAQGRQLIAVGTTTTRCLEFLARGDRALEHSLSGFCNLFIYPGFEFRMLDGLLTNFHLPQSTLFMLVCAFAGRELMLDCYSEAIANNYRFYSYGDCMLLL